MSGKIIFIFFAVLVLGLVIFSVQSGFWGKLWVPAGSLFSYKASNWFLPVSSSSPAPVYTTPSSSYSLSSGDVAPPAIATSEIPTGFTRNDLSLSFKKVAITSAWAGTLYSYGQITLSTNAMTASDTIDITGWQIKTMRGGEYIPQAVNIYDPSGLAAASDIILKQNQYVNIYSSSGSFNLRLNKCIGYVGNANHFTPALPSNCPSFNAANVPSVTGACTNYIYSLGSCAAPNLSDIRIPQTDYTCRDYLDTHFNYKSCFDEHSGDADFLANEWRVWMGSSPLDQYHDTVRLLDKQGLLVSQYTY